MMDGFMVRGCGTPDAVDVIFATYRFTCLLINWICQAIDGDHISRSRSLPDMPLNTASDP